MLFDGNNISIDVLFVTNNNSNKKRALQKNKDCSFFDEGKGGLDNGYHYEIVWCWFRLTYHCLWYLTRWVVRNQRRVASILFFL